MTATIQEQSFTEVTPEPVTVEQVVVGCLEMVDVGKNHFRILGSDGATVEIWDMPDPWETSRLVTQYVVATGAIRQVGRKTVMHSPVIGKYELPDFRTESAAQEEVFFHAMASAQPYDPDEVVPCELTEEEWGTFWEAVHGG